MAIINGTPGDDNSAATNGTNQSDTINLFGGNDQTRPGDGSDNIFGGSGIDRVSYINSDAGVNVNLLTNSGIGGYADGDSYSSIENIFGSAFNDVLRGNAQANLLSGYFGNDNIYAGDGNDTLVGDTGIDSMFGQDGNDLLFGGADTDFLYGGTGNDILVAGAGNDFIYGGNGNDLMRGDAGADSFNGGSGIDLISYVASAASVRVNLATGDAVGGDAQGDTFVSVENLEGSSNNDRLTGNAGVNQLFGGAGNDVLDGGAGADILQGGLGNDFYFIDNVDDVIVGEIGFSLGGGVDAIRSFVNYTQPDNVELMRLGFKDDTDDLEGIGNDAPGVIVGNAGNNVLIGRGGNDQLNGNDGDDTIIGNSGRDSFVGGAGDDTFVFLTYADSRAGAATRDFVNGFTNGSDQIDLSALDANTRTFGTDDAFTFIGNDRFTAAGSASAGELRTLQLGGQNAVIVEADHNGDGVADLQIFVNQTNFMTSDDFIL